MGLKGTQFPESRNLNVLEGSRSSHFLPLDGGVAEEMEARWRAEVGGQRPASRAPLPILRALQWLFLGGSLEVFVGGWHGLPKLLLRSYTLVGFSGIGVCVGA